MSFNIESLPLKIKNNIDVSKCFSIHTRGVAVQYCVLQPFTEDNT